MALKFFNSKNNFHVNIVFQLQCCPLKLFMYQHISPMDHTTTPFFTRSEEKAISLVEAGKNDYGNNKNFPQKSAHKSK